MALHGISIKPSHRGLFHKDVGKSPGAKITTADIDKGLASKDPAERKRAQFAKNARGWNKGGSKPKKRTESARATTMYGKDSKSKRATTSAAQPTRRLPK